VAKKAKKKGIEGVKACVKSLIKMGCHNAQIREIILKDEDFSDLDTELVNKVITDFLAVDSNYKLIQRIVRSTLVKDKDSNENGEIFIINEDRDSFFTMHKTNLTNLFHPSFDVKYKILIAEFVYDPFLPSIFTQATDTSLPRFNTFTPPFWMKPYFYSNTLKEIPKVNKIPDIYYKFLNHLVDNNLQSYEYILNWLANGLKRRNFCILTTIGNQGIGKGVLNDIMTKLFGVENSYAGSDRMFKGVFNSQISNKRLVYCDEISIKDKEEEDKIKLVVNEVIEIEKKGIDAKQITNYANFYISSNNLDAISLTEDDRRFSIVDLTSKPLIAAFSEKDIKELFEDKNIQELAFYLWNREVNTEAMLRVFKTARTEEVRLSGLKEWEDWFLFKYCKDNKNKELEIWEAGEVIKEQFGFNTRIGRSKLMQLAQKYSNIFKIKLCSGEENRKTWKLHIGG